MNRTLCSFAMLLVAVGGVLFVGACGPRQAGPLSREVQVNITENGFEPAVVRIPAGHAVTLVMTRKTDQTCGTEVEFPSLGRKYSLPLDQPIRIALPPRPAGTISFQCGMHMLAGRVIVQ